MDASVASTTRGAKNQLMEFQKRQSPGHAEADRRCAWAGDGLVCQFVGRCEKPEKSHRFPSPPRPADACRGKNAGGPGRFRGLPLRSPSQGGLVQLRLGILATPSGDAEWERADVDVAGADSGAVSPYVVPAGRPAQFFRAQWVSP